MPTRLGVPWGLEEDPTADPSGLMPQLMGPGLPAIAVLQLRHGDDHVPALAARRQIIRE